MPTFEEFLDTYTPPAQAGQALNIANGYTKPEDAALALKTARESGLPAETVDLDPTGFAQQQRQRENARILEANQSLSAFIGENPVEGKAIHDDLDKLDFFTKQLTAIKSGWQRGKLEEIRGNIGFTASLGLGGEERAEELSQEAAALPEFKEGPAHWAQAIAGMISGSLVDLSIGGGAGLVGAAGGAAVGPVGAAIGFTGGALAGMGAAMGTAARGRTYLDLKKARDENGQPLSELNVQIASGLVGVTVGAIGMLGLKSAASQEVASGIIREATVEAMKNPGFREALTKGTVELAKGGTTGAAMMGSITAIQEGVMDAAKGLSDGDWKTLANDPKRRQEVVSAINQAMVEGAVLVGNAHGDIAPGKFTAGSVMRHCRWHHGRDVRNASPTNARDRDGVAPGLNPKTAPGPHGDFYQNYDRISITVIGCDLHTNAHAIWVQPRPGRHELPRRHRRTAHQLGWQLPHHRDRSRRERERQDPDHRHRRRDARQPRVDRDSCPV
jgi:hypothetical protein